MRKKLISKHESHKLEQTTQDDSKHQIKWNNVHTKKLPTEIGSFSIFNLYIV